MHGTGVFTCFQMALQFLGRVSTHTNHNSRRFFHPFSETKNQKLGQLNSSIAPSILYFLL